jgi:hypothetical protein
VTVHTSGVIRWAVLAIGLSWVSVPTFGQLSGQQGGSRSTQSMPKSGGFFDYVLGRINPENTNYGASMEKARSSLVEYTIDDLYFLSNAVTLVVLSGLAAIVLLQWRAMNKRELIAASLVTQLWNGRVSDRIEIERRTEQFNQLAERHNAEVERTLSQKENQDIDTYVGVARGVRDLTRTNPTTAPEKTASDPATPQAAPALAAARQNILLLQRRVEDLQNSERNLKQQLHQTMALLKGEQRRNASLKGAPEKEK